MNDKKYIGLSINPVLDSIVANDPMNRLLADAREQLRLKDEKIDHITEQCIKQDRENDELRAQLAAAEQRITELENDRDMWKRAFENGGTETMQKQLTKAEQRVAEACTLLCMDAVTKSKSSLFRSGAIIVAGEIRDGAWRKFVKEV